MIRKNPQYDMENPPGQVVNPIPDVMTPISKIIERAKITTWNDNKETPEQAYARGWADAIYEYESRQRKNRDI